MRIIPVADAYDAMTTNRSYRWGLSHERAIQILCENSGTQFDPRIVELFVNLPREILNGQPDLTGDAEQVEQPDLAEV